MGNFPSFSPPALISLSAERGARMKNDPEGRAAARHSCNAAMSRSFSLGAAILILVQRTTRRRHFIVTAFLLCETLFWTHNCRCKCRHDAASIVGRTTSRHRDDATLRTQTDREANCLDNWRLQVGVVITICSRGARVFFASSSILSSRDPSSWETFAPRNPFIWRQDFYLNTKRLPTAHSLRVRC